jgi:HSP20 family protein
MPDERKVERPETNTAAGIAAVERRAYRPRVDIFESEQNYRIVIDMPGVAADGVDVTAEQDRLVVRGHAVDAPPPGYHSAHREYVAGDYVRTFALPDGIDRDKTTARLRDGVLTVTLPKAAAAKPRRIEVTSGT